jgi:hypothetical protein
MRLTDICPMRILFTLFVALLTTAQAAAQGGLHGPRFGLGLSTQSIGGLFQNTSNLMPAPLFGWHLDFPVHPQMSIMPELLWMTKGFVVRNPTDATRTKSTFRYLEMPITLKVHMDKNRQDGLFLIVGPSLGYFMNGNFKQWSEDELIIDADYVLPATGRKFDFSGLVGIGVEGDKWSFDVRAQSSLTPFEQFTTIHNVVYGLTFAYRIPMKKAAEE